MEVELSQFQTVARLAAVAFLRTPFAEGDHGFVGKQLEVWVKQREAIRAGLERIENWGSVEPAEARRIDRTPCPVDSVRRFNDEGEPNPTFSSGMPGASDWVANTKSLISEVSWATYPNKMNEEVEADDEDDDDEDDSDARDDDPVIPPNTTFTAEQRAAIAAGKTDTCGYCEIGTCDNCITCAPRREAWRAEVAARSVE